MSQINKEIWIDKPKEKVFSYINNPNNWMVFCPPLWEIKDVQALPNGGYSGRWQSKVMGVRFQGTVECTDITPNQYLVIDTNGGIRSTLTWILRSWYEKTRVNLTIDYRVPVPLLGKLAEAIIMNMTDLDADLMMTRLQTICETASY